MSNDISVRDIEIADLPALLDIYLELNPDDPLLSLQSARIRYEAIVNIPDSAVLGAKIDDKLVGTCTLIVCPNLSRGGKPYGLIENVVTSDKYRRRGVGAALMKAACERSKLADCYKIMLLTGSKDPATHRFYRRCGFAGDKTGFQKRFGVPVNNRISGP